MFYFLLLVNFIQKYDLFLCFGLFYRIGQKIRRLGEYRYYSQDSVAMEMGMSPSGYSRIERDEVSIPGDKLNRLAEI